MVVENKRDSIALLFRHFRNNDTEGTLLSEIQDTNQFVINTSKAQDLKNEATQKATKNVLHILVIVFFLNASLSKAFSLSGLFRNVFSEVLASQRPGA